MFMFFTDFSRVIQRNFANVSSLMTKSLTASNISALDADFTNILNISEQGYKFSIPIIILFETCMFYAVWIKTQTQSNSLLFK